jgi:hypothetical protein
MQPAIAASNLRMNEGTDDVPDWLADLNNLLTSWEDKMKTWEEKIKSMEEIITRLNAANFRCEQGAQARADFKGYPWTPSSIASAGHDRPLLALQVGGLRPSYYPLGYPMPYTLAGHGVDRWRGGAEEEPRREEDGDVRQRLRPKPQRWLPWLGRRSMDSNRRCAAPKRLAPLLQH